MYVSLTRRASRKRTMKGGKRHIPMLVKMAASCMSSVHMPVDPAISLILLRYAPPENVGGTNMRSNIRIPSGRGTQS